MEVLGKVDGEHAEKFIKKTRVARWYCLPTNTAYKHIEDIVATHFTVISGKESTNDALQWVHKAISNLNWELIHMIT